MVVLTVEGLQKQFGTKHLFSDVSFGVDEGDKIGFIGANGCGKSTLLRIIAGDEPADAGRVMVANNSRIAWLPQDSPYDPDDTVLQAVLKSGGEALELIGRYELACHELEERHGEDPALADRVSDLAHQLDACGAWELESNAKAVLGKLGLYDLTAPMGALSGGQRKRVALAHALLTPSDALILDEPTNHLDADTVEWLEGYLRRYQGAVLLVTHDRYFLDRVATRMVELDGQTARTYTGGYSRYLEQKAVEAEQEALADRKRRALVKQELEWMRTGCKARTTKQKARLQRAGELVYAPKKQEEKALEIGFGSERLGDKVVEFHKVSKAWGDKVLLSAFDYKIGKGERIGIIGPNGSGKTTLFEMIAGRTTPDSGHIDIGSTVRIGYYDQESRQLDDSKRVIETVQEEAEQIKLKDGSVLSASKMLERFLFPPNVQYAPVGTLSGGERRRLYLLMQLMRAPNVLLLDEPTNDLDIPTLRVLEEFLDAWEGCLIVVSHDRYFLDRTVEEIFAYEGKGRIERYPGNYTLYLEVKAEREKAALREEKKKAPKPQEAPQPQKPAGKLNSREKKELEKLETAIAAAEERQEAISAELAAAGSDYEAVQRLGDELKAIQAKLETDMDRWAELADRA